jgi:hypothetical protein
VRFKSPPKRQVAPTRDEIRAIVDEADARGMFAYATGLLIQWVFSLRGVDVFGQWLPTRRARAGIRRGKRRWADGLTWDMVEPDLSAFSKVISKTANALPEPTRFPLEDAGEIRARLRSARQRGTVGTGDRLGEGGSTLQDRRALTGLRTAPERSSRRPDPPRDHDDGHARRCA